MKKRLLLPLLATCLSFPSVSTMAAEPSATVRHLAEAIRIPTVSHQDRESIDYTQFQDFHRFLRDTYPLAHSRLQVDTIAGYSLLFTWPGSDPSLKPVLFDAHYDVVPVEPGTEQDWTYPAFEGRIADGYLWGRGALDDKASVIATLEALEQLLAGGYQPQRTLLFSFGHDEEIGGDDGARNISAHLKAKHGELEYMVAEGGLVLIDNPMLPGKSMAMINLAEKTYVTLTLSVSGEGGHSSMPVKDNAIVRLSRATAKLHDNPFEPRLISPISDMLEVLGAETGGFKGFAMRNQWLASPLLLSAMSEDRATQAMVRSTTAVTMFNAGVKENVIPQRAEAKVNFRLLPDTTVEALITSVRELIDDPAVDIAAEAWKTSPPVASMDTEAYRHLQTAINSVLPDALVVPGMLTATTDTPHYRELTPNIYRFHPFTVQMGDAGTIHGTDERISLDSADTAKDLSLALIQAAGTP
ncbi:M20/M25/M40 family metallo-hydrolase [Parahaliea mediterranea]|uniref:M20/M25/M40 family metallo-hydrolase n=1 Tax=Parahaliea mediterranea TaxID=651086 RepID=A0A939DHR4_9GAMM|nr:M20/M25/M40 family metallo-hydrolase [Parahaliea mediterranea]MBN7798324.1 M20/M25/M40 family metallo-hydrolase [Parahaliea mediterranea]